MAYLGWVLCDLKKNFRLEYFHEEINHCHKNFETVWINQEQIIIQSKDKEIYPNFSRPQRPDFANNIPKEVCQLILDSGIVDQDAEIYNLYNYLEIVRDSIDQDLSIKLEDFETQFKEMK